MQPVPKGEINNLEKSLITIFTLVKIIWREDMAQLSGVACVSSLVGMCAGMFVYMFV